VILHKRRLLYFGRVALFAHFFLHEYISGTRWKERKEEMV